MKILVYDFETTGLVPGEDKIIEVGAVLWDTERNLPLELYSKIVNQNVEISQVITDLTTITNEDIQEYGVDPVSAFAPFYRMMVDADFLCGHNAARFDERMLLFQALTLPWPLPEKLTLDTQHDIEYSKQHQAKNLTYLAASHGFLNPFPHRALTDCLTTAKILAYYPIKQMIEIAEQPKVTLIANPKPPWTDNKAETSFIKTLGYKWDGEQKFWFKDILQKHILKEREQLGSIKSRLLEGEDGKAVLRERKWWKRENDEPENILIERNRSGVDTLSSEARMRGRSVPTVAASIMGSEPSA